MRDGKYALLTRRMNIAFKNIDTAESLLSLVADAKHSEIDSALLNECCDELRDILFKVAHSVDEEDQEIVTSSGNY